MKPGRWASLCVSFGMVLTMASFGLANPAIAAHSARHAATTHTARSSAATCAKQNTASGVIKYSDWQFPDTLNPYQTGASVSFETIDIMLESAGLLLPNGHLKLDVFSKLKAVGSKEFTATVRSGARWSNGQPITSADFKFAWQIYNNKDSGPYAPGIGLDQVARIDTPTKSTLVFHMKQPFAPFYLETMPGYLPWPVSWPGAWAKGDVKAATDKLFQDQSFNFENPSFPTNGPYQVTQFVNNDRIVLRPMKYYRTLSCGGRIKQPIFVFYSAKPDLIAAAAQKATDTTTNFTPADVATLVQHKNAFKTYVTPAFEEEHLSFNLDPTYNGAPNPLHDVKVRQALALALDKLGLIQSATGLSASVSKPLEAWSPMIVTPKLLQSFGDKSLKGQWDPIAKKYQSATGKGQALADAKKLIAQTSCASGCTIDGMTTSGNPTRAAEFSVMQTNWAKIGVKYNPSYIPASKLFGTWDEGAPPHLGTFQIAMWTDVLTPDPDAFKTIFECKYIDRRAAVHSGINGNVDGVCDSALDTAFAKGASSLDPKVRAKEYKVFQDKVNQQVYWLPLYYRTDITTTDGKLQPFIPNGTGAGPQWNAYAWFVKK